MPHSENPSHQPLSLLDYLLVLFRHKKTILLSTFAVALATAVVSLFMPNLYVARAMILPADDDKGTLGAMVAQMGGLAAAAGSAALAGGPTKGELYVTMLGTETVLDPIVDRFKLMESYQAKFRVKAYRKLKDATALSISKKDGTLTISFQDQDPKRAAEIANAYVTELGKMTAGINMTSAGKGKGYLQEQLSTARANLAVAEEAMKSFQEKNKAISVTDQAKASIEAVALLRGQIAAQEVQLATMRHQFAETSREVKSARATIANLQAQINKFEGGQAGTSSIPTVGSVPELGQEYVRLMREFKIQETLVEMLTKQYEMTRISELKDVVPFQVIQLARVPELKSKPLRAKMTIAAAIGALVVSSMLVLLLEFLRSLPEERRGRLKSMIKGGARP